MDISMNILSWVALAVLIVFALNGLRRGLIMTVFSTFTLIVAIIVAVNVSPHVSRTWQNTAFFSTISQRVEKSLFGEADTGSGEITQPAEQAELIQELPLPASVKDLLLENNNSQIYDALGIAEFRGYVAHYIACLIVNALSFIIVFLAVIIILKVIAAALNIISYLPVLHSLNKLGGFVFGIVNGLAVLWVVCIAATIFSGTELGGYIYSQINTSTFLRLIYDNNYLMTIVSSLKYLLV